MPFLSGVAARPLYAALFFRKSIRSFAFAICALLYAALASFDWQANAAMPGKDDNFRNLSGNVPENKKEAAAAISGSPWQGVIDHLLQRPLPDGEKTGRRVNIHINYPSIGDRLVDADIRAWASGIADAFESHLDLSSNLDYAPEPETDLDQFPQDDDLNSTFAAATSENGNFELWGNYTVSRPSNAAVSITFELWNYTSSNQGNLDVITLNYSLLNGQRLNFVDIFEKPDVALELMASWSRKQLEQKLGSALSPRMLEDGTEPLVENFSSLTLTPTGICINFQPYQVAPGETGIQKVEMPLEELAVSAPLLALWGK